MFLNNLACPERQSKERKEIKKLFLVVLLISMLVVPVFAYNWVTNPANGHRYTSWLAVDAGWQGAKNQAITLGGHLVTIDDLSENEWIRSTFGPFDFCWIGLYETNYISRQWTWASGEPLNFTFWGFGEPSVPGAEHWVTICNWSTPPGSWADLSSDWIGATHNAVVEVIPEPGSFVTLGAFIIPLALLRRRKR